MDTKIVAFWILNSETSYISLQRAKGDKVGEKGRGYSVTSCRLKRPKEQNYTLECILKL
jgi:hypothetical protein